MSIVTPQLMPLRPHAIPAVQLNCSALRSPYDIPLCCVVSPCRAYAVICYVYCVLCNVYCVFCNRYVTSWIMTVFVSAFHFDFAVRVWDVLWVEGWKVVYKVCIGILKYAEPKLLTLNMEEIMMYFRKLPDRMNPEEVWKAIWSVKLSQEEVRVNKG